MPNSGHRELIPPSGSFTPCHRKNPQARDNHRARSKNRGIPTRPPQRLVDVSERVLDHEARHPRARIQNRQDEQRFKHHGEVIPERHHGAAAQALRKNVRHAHGKCRSASGAVEKRVLSDGAGQRLHVLRQSREIPS